MENEFRSWVEAQLVQAVISCEPIRSAPENRVYHIATHSGTYFAKRGPNLEHEYEKLRWLNGKLPVPKVVAFRRVGIDVCDMITTPLPGKDLGHLAKQVDLVTLIHWLGDALRMIKSVDITDCPFAEGKAGEVFVHGDACLPNFLVRDPLLGISDIIDVDKARIGSHEEDIAAVVWSLVFNCGEGAGRAFLQTYCRPEATLDDEVRYIRMFEPTWSGY